MEVWQPACPATEYGGLLFSYLGPPGTEPLFPRFDIIDIPTAPRMSCCADTAVGRLRGRDVKDCNWLQHYENIVDPYHL
jgi:phenylpropionate dioxygenase-like ring-hydroxylating dioxygenase large terminal subunit